MVTEFHDSSHASAQEAPRRGALRSHSGAAQARLALLVAATGSIACARTPGSAVVPVECVDGQKNGTETAVDCGGVCTPCPLGFACGGDDDCSFGLLCGTGICRSPCEQGSCAGSAVCVNGGCVECGTSSLPTVTGVDGTGSTDGRIDYGEHHIQDRLALRGSGLFCAAVSLVGPGGASQALERCAVGTDDAIEVALPDSLVAGDYVLSVVNAAGTCDSTIRLLQGEAGMVSDSNFYIQNQATAAQPASFSISGTAYVGGPVGIGVAVPAEGLEIAGNLRLGGPTATYRVLNMAEPVSSSDGATKSYVDAAATGTGGSGCFQMNVDWITAHKHYFLTAGTYTGDLGGLSGADMICNADANALAGKSYHAIRNADTTWNAPGIGLYNAVYGEATNFILYHDFRGCGTEVMIGSNNICNVAVGDFQQGKPIEVTGATASSALSVYKAVSDVRKTTSATNCSSWTSATGSSVSFFGFSEGTRLGELRHLGPVGFPGETTCAVAVPLLCVED